MADAAERAARRGVFAMVGFSYRGFPRSPSPGSSSRGSRSAGCARCARIPSGLARRRGGADDLAPRQGPAGSGSLGDIGAHAIDAVQFITGRQSHGVSGILETLVTERPLLGESIGLGGTASNERGG